MGERLLKKYHDKLFLEDTEETAEINKETNLKSQSLKNTQKVKKDISKDNNKEKISLKDTMKKQLEKDSTQQKVIIIGYIKK